MKQLIQKCGMLVLLLLSFLSASAYDFEVDGLYYNIVSPSDLTCELTYKERQGDGKYYNDYANKKLTIPTSVSYLNKNLKVIRVSSFAFYKSEAIEEVEIPPTIKYIASTSFYECTNLHSVVIMDGVTLLNIDSGFYGCPIDNLYWGREIVSSGLLSWNKSEIPLNVCFSDYVSSIPDKTFYGCENLFSITLTDKITKIGKNAFNGCVSLETIEGAVNVSQIEEYAFKNCQNLKAASFLRLKKIGEGIFSGCKSITQVNLGNYITVIPEECFLNCSSLKDCRLSNSLKKISDNSFEGCLSLDEFRIPGTVTNLGEEVLKGCDNLKTLIIENGDTPLLLPLHFFYWSKYGDSNSSIENLVVNRNLTKERISHYGVFHSLKTIRIGNKVSSIHCIYWIDKCSDLSLIISENATPPETNWVLPNSKYMTVEVLVPIGAKHAYEQAEFWTNFWNIKESEEACTIITNIFDNENHNTHYQVYNLMGILLLNTDDKDKIKELPTGMYIINGKKTFIK